MAINRQPTASVVNGAYLQVRNPNAESGDVFADYQTMPGLTSFTLPAETGAVSETPLMDGVVSAAQFKGVGTITAAVGALGAHPVHLFMEKAALDGDQVQMNIIRPATNIGSRALTAGMLVAAGQTNDPARRVVSFANAQDREWVRNNILWGHIVLITLLTDGTAAFNALSGNAASPTVAAFDGDAIANPPATGATLTQWQTVLEVDEDGDTITLAPGFTGSGAVITAAAGAAIHVRNPGRSYSNIIGVVNQWDAGDYQGGAVVTGNMTFTPSVALPLVSVEQRTSIS